MRGTLQVLDGLECTSRTKNPTLIQVKTVRIGRRVLRTCEARGDDDAGLGHGIKRVLKKQAASFACSSIHACPCD